MVDITYRTRKKGVINLVWIITRLIIRDYMYLIFDLDQTLLKEDKTISSQTKTVLKKCQEMGHKIVINSARPYLHIKPISDEINADYFITNSGAEGFQKDKILFTNYIDKDKTLEIISYFLTNNVLNFSVQTDSKLLTTNKKFAEKDKYAQYYDFKNCDFNALKIIFETTDNSIGDFLMDKYGLYIVNYLGGTFHSATSGNKYIGNTLLFKALGEKNPEVIAFGDDLSDILMLQNATYGVAMKNSQPAVKAIAKYQTEYTNDEDGCSKYIEKMIKDGIIK